MKRFFTFLLALTLVCSLCACGGSGDEAKTPEGLQIGYSKINITPDFSTGLGGYSNSETRKSNGLLDYVYLTCIAASEGEDTVLLYTIDICGFAESRWKMFRDVVAPATGIPADRIYFGATHTHSAPEINEQADGSKFKTLILDCAVEAANKALADRTPATIETATGKIEGMNFLRHYLMQDGSYAGPNFGDYSKGFVSHAAESETDMVLVKFNRGGGEKKDVVMVNWQAHPDHTGEIGQEMISSDFIGPLRDELERLSGTHVAYFTAADGDQTYASKITELNPKLNCKEYGIKLGQLANDILAQAKPLEGTGIATTGTTCDVEIDHSWDHMLDAANEIYELWKSTGNAEGEAKTLGRKKYDFSSVYQARAIRTRAANGPTAPRELNAIKIGGLGIVTATYEMAGKNGRYIKENSPFETTFIITSNSGYMPTPEQYDYRCYEADTALYAKGSAEKLATEYVKLLDAIK